MGDGGYRCWLPEEANDEEEKEGDEEGISGEGEEWLLGVEERVNPLAGTAWEVDLLRRHYSPKVRSAVEEVVRGMGSGGSGEGGGGGKEKGKGKGK